MYLNPTITYLLVFLLVMLLVSLFYNGNNIYFTIKVWVNELKSDKGYVIFLLFDKNSAQKVSDALYFGNVKVEYNKASYLFNNIRKYTYLIAIIHNEGCKELFNRPLVELNGGTISYFEVYRNRIGKYCVKRANEKSSFNEHIKYKIQIET